LPARPQLLAIRAKIRQSSLLVITFEKYAAALAANAMSSWPAVWPGATRSRTWEAGVKETRRGKWIGAENNSNRETNPTRWLPHASCTRPGTQDQAEFCCFSYSSFPGVSLLLLSRSITPLDQGRRPYMLYLVQKAILRAEGT
jgi:hypothetical protein